MPFDQFKDETGYDFFEFAIDFGKSAFQKFFYLIDLLKH